MYMIRLGISGYLVWSGSERTLIRARWSTRGWSGGIPPVTWNHWLFSYNSALRVFYFIIINKPLGVSVLLENIIGQIASTRSNAAKRLNDSCGSAALASNCTDRFYCTCKCAWCYYHYCGTWTAVETSRLGRAANPTQTLQCGKNVLQAESAILGKGDWDLNSTAKQTHTSLRCSFRSSAH